MTETINTEAGLFRFLLARLSTPHRRGSYPPSFAIFAEQMIARLSEFDDDADVLRLGNDGPTCPCCGSQGGALFAMMLKELHSGRDLLSCHRGIPTLALELLAQASNGIRLREANLAMIELLGLTRNGLITVVEGAVRTTEIGAEVFGACIDIRRVGATPDPTRLR